MGNWMERDKESAARRAEGTAAAQRAFQEKEGARKTAEESRLMSIGRMRLREFDALEVPEKLADINREWKNLGKLVTHTEVTPTQAAHSASLLYTREYLQRERERVEETRFGFYTEHHTALNPEQQSYFAGNVEHKFGFHKETVGYRTVSTKIVRIEESLKVEYSTDPRSGLIKVEIYSGISTIRPPTIDLKQGWKIEGMIHERATGSSVVISFSEKDSDSNFLAGIVDVILLQACEGGLRNINYWEEEKNRVKTELQS